MNEKFDLARMLREIADDADSRADKNRSLSQEEIKRLVAQRKKTASVTPPPAQS